MKNPFRSSTRIITLITIGPVVAVAFLFGAYFGSDNGWNLRNGTGGVDYLGRITVEIPYNR